MSFWSFLLIVLLLAIIAVLLAGHSPASATSTAFNLAVSAMQFIANKFKRSSCLLFLAGSLVAFPGCLPQPKPYPLPVRPPEAPVCNLPSPLHQRNELGKEGQGSCVHASLVNHLRWLNQFEMASRWWATYGDGEYASRLMRRLDAAKIEYAYTEKADPRFLDWCTLNRTGAILWWKPSHCCTFVGFSMGSDILRYDPQAKVDPGTQYACILDNNYPGRFEYTERTQFIRLWASYGGFALCVLDSPAPSIPYRSYELR